MQGERSLAGHCSCFSHSGTVGKQQTWLPSGAGARAREVQRGTGTLENEVCGGSGSDLSGFPGWGKTKSSSPLRQVQETTS